ncbi:MAG: hypothetical protein HOV81_37945 [Kofleriaceae bacterium]|nr:hypothetical protein [Kofleriaceae bacterium]
MPPADRRPRGVVPAVTTEGRRKPKEPRPTVNTMMRIIERAELDQLARDLDKLE